jgi:hypothetical protein
VLLEALAVTTAACSACTKVVVPIARVIREQLLMSCALVLHHCCNVYCVAVITTRLLTESYADTTECTKISCR